MTRTRQNLQHHYHQTTTATSVCEVDQRYRRGTEYTAPPTPAGGRPKPSDLGSCQRTKACASHFPQRRQNHSCKSRSESSKKWPETSPWTRPDLCKLLLGHPLPRVGGTTPAVDKHARTIGGGAARIRGALNHRLTRHMLHPFKS